jgi:hypothetical protein
MKRPLAIATLVAVITALSIMVAPVSAAPAPNVVLGDLTAANAAGYTFTGTLSNAQFVNQNGQLAIVGNLTGTLKDATGAVDATVSNLPINLPVTGAAANGSCTILDLTLGPLHLDLLGLVVDLNQVHLTITGQTGPGNLLGNLLCGLANSLNGTGGGGGLAGILNQILGL